MVSPQPPCSTPIVGRDLCMTLKEKVEDWEKCEGNEDHRMKTQSSPDLARRVRASPQPSGILH